ncbi:MAG: hypothetical protein NXI10_10400 [bacterium]|nr:hypothetical protein [bacterium]
MIRLLLIFFGLTLVCTVNGQDSTSTIELNKLFEIRVDSIEQKVTINKWGADTSYYLHFQVKNISTDTLTYKTNTCFYYNHSVLNVENLEFDLNPDGGCLFNSHNIYKLSPGEAFSEAQSITAYNYQLNKLKIGEWNSSLSVPLVKDDSTTYRVDGRSFIENQQYLKCENRTKVVKTIVDNSKRKKKNKKHLTQAKKS